MLVLSVADISKRFGTRWALRSVSLDVPRGRVVAVIGPSGCGKSTLLRVLVGLVRPTEGRVLLQDLSAAPDQPVRLVTARDWPRLRTRIGYVIQDGGLLPHITVRRNILLPLRAQHANMPASAEAGARLEALADTCHLPPELLDRYPAQLSGGERQRAALVRSLITEPDMLLLDEPLAALDPQIRAGLQTELRDLFARLERTVVLVTHDLAEAAFLAHEIVLMNEGRIVQRGSFADLLERPAEPFVNDFVAQQVDRVRGLLEGAGA